MEFKCKICGANGATIRTVKNHKGIYCTNCSSFVELTNKEEPKDIGFNDADKISIKVKYLRDIPKLKPITIGNWIDLYVGEDIVITQGECACIPLGVAMQLPEGYEAIIAPRSSTFKRYGLIQTNGIGIIDESYNGDGDEWCIPVYALGSDAVYIPKGTRICQFRVLKHQPICSFDEVTTLGNSDRGGFGVTGV